MTKRLKILFDAGPLVNGNKSGVGYYTYGLLESLAKYHPETKIVAHYFNFLGRKKSLDLPTYPNITYVESRLMPGKTLNLLRKVGLQLPLEALFKSHGDAAIFTNFVSLPSISRIPTFVAVHDLCFIDVPEYVAKSNRKFLTRFVPKSIRSAHKVITISESTKQAIQRNYGTSDEKLVITPIPPASAKSITPEKPSSLDGEFMLFVSTLEPRKNIIGLVEGYKKLPESLRDRYSLVLAGGMGWYMEDTIKYIQTLRRKGYQIILTGYITDAEKEWLYDNAAMFVMPSHYEGFGMPILEAMSHGLPTVVSDIEVFHEVAGDAAVYFDKDDPKSIADAMKKVLLDKSVHKELVKKGRSRVKKFNWEKSAEIIYEQLMLQSDK